MTAALAHVFAEAAKLPDAEQERFALRMLDELESVAGAEPAQFAALRAECFANREQLERDAIAQWQAFEAGGTVQRLDELLDEFEPVPPNA